MNYLKNQYKKDKKFKIKHNYLKEQFSNTKNLGVYCPLILKKDN